MLFGYVCWSLQFFTELFVDEKTGTAKTETAK